MYLFEKQRTTDFLRAISQRIVSNIEKLTDEEICNTDLDELEEYYVSENQIEEIEIFKDHIENDLSETKIKVDNPLYRNGSSEWQYFSIDGFKVTFMIPFDGDENLLYLTPSKYYISNFPVDRVVSPTKSEYGKIVISLEFKKKELQEKENSKEFVETAFKKKMKIYFDTIDRINDEVRSYNFSLPVTVKECLTKRRQKAEDYLQMRECLELPLNLNANAPNTKPVLLKKAKKKTAFPSQKKSVTEYAITNDDYENIKNIIVLACISMEKTACTFTKLSEEELRDVILSNLNTHYLGSASGETFNKTGKTDIYIPFGNKAAYIAECKIWHGSKRFLEAIRQLSGYTTWRDIKTSLIIFNKDNKNFNTILDAIDQSLNSICKDIIRQGQNQWQGTFSKEKGSDDMLTINITAYDLYICSE